MRTARSYLYPLDPPLAREQVLPAANSSASRAVIYRSPGVPR
jgi:hypothetical protein